MLACPYDLRPDARARRTGDGSQSGLDLLRTARMWTLEARHRDDEHTGPSGFHARIP